ncbi:unnamed protein product [Brassica napus]|uniref:(rape) hypothetical protein n=1 Tax=Brassica napus TaxID=3708 RepID=A0A816XTW7_BRANA|nr:unnamed protein product [Brassica napus]
MQSRGSTRAATEPPSPGDNTEKEALHTHSTIENQSQDLPVSRNRTNQETETQSRLSRDLTGGARKRRHTPDLSPQEPSLTDPPRMETRLEAARTEQGLRQRPQRGGDEPVEQRGKKERKLPTTAYGTTAVGAKGTRRLH